jgi:hypothetical protein
MKTSEYFNTLKMIHYGFAGGLIIFMIVLLLLSFFGILPIISGNTELSNLLPYLVIGIGIANIALGFLVFNTLLNKAKQGSFSEQLLAYKQGFIIRSATVEGSGIFALVSYLLIGSLQSLLIAAFILGVLIILRPSRTEIIKVFKLEGSELLAIEDDEQNLPLQS